MSVQEDDIIVEIGDSSIAKLAKALGGGSGGGSEGGKKGVGGIAGMLQKITGGFAGGLAKVALITTGITGIFGLVKTIVGASPMLKRILKLFNFGIMLILRPIGDFIGFFFRPIIVMLLRMDTSTEWFKLLQENKALFLWVNGRLKFGDTNKPANFPSMLVILNNISESKS